MSNLEGFIIFVIGLFGYSLSNKKLIKCLIATEIMFLAAIYVFVNSDIGLKVKTGSIFTVFVIAISIIDVGIYIYLKQNFEDN